MRIAETRQEVVERHRRAHEATDLMWRSTHTIGGMTIAFILALVVVGIFATAALAQPVVIGTGGKCTFNKEGKLDYFGKIEKPCSLLKDPRDPGGVYLRVEEPGKPHVLYRWDFEKREGRIVGSL